jgi:hypothetical protein
MSKWPSVFTALLLCAALSGAAEALAADSYDPLGSSDILGLPKTESKRDKRDKHSVGIYRPMRTGPIDQRLRQGNEKKKPPGKPHKKKVPKSDEETI